MDLQLAQYILKVAQTGNITRAAAELYMTQPALSRYIAKIEKEEGIQIFDRTTSPLSLTYAGERYVETIRKMIALNEQLHEELAEISSHKKGKLTIGIPPARAASMLPVFLPEFVDRCPNVDIYTVEHNSRQLREDVLRGRVDFAILPLLEPLDGFRCEDLYQEELFLVSMEGALPESAWRTGADGCRVIDFAALKDQTFILLKNGHGIRNALDILFGYQGIQPNIFMETTNNETAFGLAAAGLGLAIVPKMCVDTLKHIRPIEVFRLSDAGLKWAISAILPPDSTERYFASKCIDVIRECYSSAIKK